MKNILVLGGNGFIGSHIVDALLNKGLRVKVFDKESDKFRKTKDGLTYTLGSYDDKLLLAEALVDIDIVIHALGTSVPSTSNNSPIDDINGNLVSTITLLNLMMENEIKRILFLSSGGTVYGIPQKIPIDEAHPTYPLCSYGIVKLAIEKYLFMYEKLYGIEPIIIRGSNLYGPRQGHIGVQGFISTVLHKLLMKEEIIIYGDGSQIRDYLYVEDLAELCYKAVISSEKGIFNAGSGMGYSLNEIISIISNISGIKLPVSKVPGRSFDVSKNVLNVNKAEAILNWKAKISIEEGILKYLTWLKNEQGSF